MFNFFKNIHLKHKLKKFNSLKDGYMLFANHEESGQGKGADIWGTDWPIPVAEEFEWHFYDDTNTGNQYITTRLTDHIFWFIPFTYDEYIYELPAGKYKHNTLTTKDVAGMIYYLEHWNWHTDEVYYEHAYNSVTINNKYFALGDNDYSFIRTK